MSKPDPAELRRFLESFLYLEAGFLVDEVVALHRDERAIEARLETTRKGERRVVIRFDSTFRQEGELVFNGNQTAMFVKDRDLSTS